MKEVVKGSEYSVDGEAEELKNASRKASHENIQDKILRSVLEKDKKSDEDGRLIAESFNQGIDALNPDIIFENIVNNYAMAKKLFGETLIRLISGYNPDYIEKNINIPEFKRELKKRIEEKIEKLKEEKLLKKDNSISEEGIKLASIIMASDELERIIPRGIFGEKIQKKASHYGERGEIRNYKFGDRYKDVAIKQSLKLAIRRGHSDVYEVDLRVSKRQSKGQAYIIYAIDASGSMKGKKIEMSKKAGMALAYKAIEAKDKVGLIIFGSEVREEIPPTDDFFLLLKEITKIKACRETDFKEMLKRSLELFPSGDFTKHLLILTDALPTVGDDPKKESLHEISKIRSAGITISLIGINLDEEGKAFAERLVEIGEGRLYVVRETEELDRIVLEDYNNILRQWGE